MIGRLVGHYRVLEKIGAGGMGEVFRAHDERLGRDVALKLIRPSSSSNQDHLRRFEQEARAAAALNHPNILAIYDVGFEGGSPYIVSELLHGKTLRVRLTEGPIPLREAADYAQQIARGLTAAHDHLIVHRDLKPENLFLTTDGLVKILDFGVAKLQNAPDDNRSIENLTTVTKNGAVLGTVAYMSPEQLRGKPVDHRSDIFSFGAILYEMLTGRRAFTGESEADTMTAVLREEPAEARLEGAGIPLAYRDLVHHCLEKDVENRFQSAKDLTFAIQTLSGSSSYRAVRIGAGRKVTLMWAVLALLVVATTALVIEQLLPAPPPATYTRLTFEPGTVDAARFTADGRSIVYSAAWNNKPTQLFTTVGDSLLSQPLNLPEATLLSISPSGELALALRGVHSGQLETVGGMLASAPLAGGSPRELLSDVRWADWDKSGGLAVVHYENNNVRLEYPIGNVLVQNRGWISNIRFSPQGDRIAFMDHPDFWDNRGHVSVVDLAGHIQSLTPDWTSEHGLAWRPDGKEIWFSAAENGNSLTLMAVTLSGKVRTLVNLPGAPFLQDVASDGRVLVALNSKRLALASGSVGSDNNIDLSWHDWNVAKDLSPDGQYVLFGDASDAAGPGYAVAMRRADGSALPMRLGEGSGGGFSPDGKWVISVSNSHPEQVTLLPVEAGQPRVVATSGLEKIQNGWARFLADGQSILLNGNEAGRAARCYLLSASGEKRRAVTPEGVSCGPSSPDGQFLAAFDASGSLNLFPIAGGESRRLSIRDKSFQPVQWSANGSSLYGYRRGEFPARLYQLALDSGTQTPLQTLHPSEPAGVVNIAPVVVSPDGKRFAYSYNQTLSVLWVISGLH